MDTAIFLGDDAQISISSYLMIKLKTIQFCSGYDSGAPHLITLQFTITVYYSFFILCVFRGVSFCLPLLC